MATGIPRDRLRDDNLNAIPARGQGKRHVYAGGGRGKNAIVHEEEIPFLSKEQLASMDEEAILDGVEQYAGDNSEGVTGFSSYFGEKASGSEMPRDMREAIEEVELSQEDGMMQEDRSETMDETHEGPSTNSGHSPISAKVAFKKRVYIAKLDTLATVYEDTGSVVTVKTVGGKWMDLSKRDVQVVDEDSVEADSEPYPSPRKRDQGDMNDAPRDGDSDSMSAYSSKKQEGSYADRRRARKEQGR